MDFGSPQQVSYGSTGVLWVYEPTRCDDPLRHPGFAILSQYDATAPGNARVGLFECPSGEEIAVGDLKLRRRCDAGPCWCLTHTRRQSTNPDVAPGGGEVATSGAASHAAGPLAPGGTVGTDPLAPSAVRARLERRAQLTKWPM